MSFSRTVYKFLGGKFRCLLTGEFDASKIPSDHEALNGNFPGK